ncbi:MAG: endonuclease domain-containing protein [Myxococcaceae bacterium]
MRISQQPLQPEALARARELRQNQTSAEDSLWFFLRDRKLNGVKFRRQHPIGPYVVDFYARALKLAVEFDGDQHTEMGRAMYNQQRTRDLNAAGVRVVRFTNDEVFNNVEGVLDRIWRFAQST